MAQLVTANPKLFSKSPDQELSESVVKVSGNSKFTRLDVREQCRTYQWSSAVNGLNMQFFSQNSTACYYGYWAIAKKVPFSKMSESPYIYTLPAGVSQKKSE